MDNHLLRKAEIILICTLTTGKLQEVKITYLICLDLSLVLLFYHY